MRPLLIAFAPLLCAGCIHVPEIGGMALPSPEAQGPISYRSLGDIPDAPPATSAAMSDSAIRLLSEQRGLTESAAGQLRTEPFSDPAPTPPEYPF